MNGIPSAAIGNLIEEIARLTIAISRLSAVIESQSNDSAGGRGSAPGYSEVKINYGSAAGAPDWAPHP